jgi:hypothetical protein
MKDIMINFGVFFLVTVMCATMLEGIYLQGMLALVIIVGIVKEVRDLFHYGTTYIPMALRDVFFRLLGMTLGYTFINYII